MARRGGFTPKQREWIKKRDGDKCVLCGAQNDLQVHHVVPYRNAMTVLGWTLERTNLPTNGITVCVKCHNGKKRNDWSNAIHPDMEYCRRMYAEDKHSYEKVFMKRDDLCRENKKYWNPAHDNWLAYVAVRNTFIRLRLGPRDVIPWDFFTEP